MTKHCTVAEDGLLSVVETCPVAFSPGSGLSSRALHTRLEVFGLKTLARLVLFLFFISLDLDKNDQDQDKKYIQLGIIFLNLFLDLDKN